MTKPKLTCCQCGHSLSHRVFRGDHELLDIYYCSFEGCPNYGIWQTPQELMPREEKK